MCHMIQRKFLFTCSPLFLQRYDFSHLEVIRETIKGRIHTPLHNRRSLSSAATGKWDWFNEEEIAYSVLKIQKRHTRIRKKDPHSFLLSYLLEDLFLCFHIAFSPLSCSLNNFQANTCTQPSFTRLSYVLIPNVRLIQTRIEWTSALKKKIVFQEQSYSIQNLLYTYTYQTWKSVLFTSVCISLTLDQTVHQTMFLSPTVP